MSEFEVPSNALLDPIPAPVLHLDADALEWQPLLALIATYSVSRVGREGLLALHPSTDQAWIELQHQLVVEIRALLDTAATIPLGGLFDPTEIAAKAQIPDAALEPDELQAAARLAHNIAAWQLLLRTPPPSANLARLIELSAGLAQNLQPLADSIQRKLLPDGTLADDASPELARIRNDQQRQQRVIEESLRSALRRLSADDQTQEDLITIRGDRFVIPVKAEHKRRVSGVVHGASSSGQTVYVEPLETIEQNNELVRLLEEEQAEIHRIFVALTRPRRQPRPCSRRRSPRPRPGRHSPGARPLRLSLTMPPAQPLPPTLFASNPPATRCSKSAFAQPAARSSPSPSNSTSDARQLIISGPNTGGKTVTLKTTALCALMAQAGIPVPATSRHVCPIFSAFLADIGDAQSIEQASRPSPPTSSTSTASPTWPDHPA